MSGAEAEVRPSYLPILKGRLGELTALSHIPKHVESSILPLVEVAPTSLEDDDEGEIDPRSVSKAMDSFKRRLASRWDSNRRIIVDAGLLPAVGGLEPPVDTAIDFGKDNFSVTPTVRPSDSLLLIQHVAEQIEEWALPGACIRLSGDDLDDTEAPLADSLERTLLALQLPPENVDVVLDLGAVADEVSASFAGRIARLVISELPYINSWRTLAVAAGSFPSDLNSVQPEVLSEFRRHELTLWRSLADRVRGRVPIFGDYGVAHPAPSGAAAFAPAPQLRYTVADGWLVMKGRKRDRRGAEQFYAICRRVTEHSEFTPDLSWGDARIAHGARADNDSSIDASPGNATTWRAIGTSHHLAFVEKQTASSTWSTGWL